MLTDVKTRQAKPRGKTYKLADGHGLYIEVSTNCGKYWRYKHWVTTNGKHKEKRLSLGVYPEVSLKSARELHHTAHALVSNGGDPSEKRQEQKRADRSIAEIFGVVGEDRFETQSPSLSETHVERQCLLFRKDLAPLHALPIDEIKPPNT